MAQWAENEVTFTVIWLNDNDLLHPVKVSQETQGTPVLSIKPADQTKPDDAQYSYTFLGWTKGDSDQVISDWSQETVTAFVIYKAKYSTTTKTYNITFKNYDNTVIKVDPTDPYDYRTYTYGIPAANIITPANNPTRPDDAQGHEYTFAGWSPEIADVT